MSDSYEYKPPLGFDIRVKPTKGRRRVEQPTKRICQWAGCDQPGPHRAPISPERLEEFRWFCQNHAREYNRAWNFFEDMTDEEVAEYQTAAVHGNRPTWPMGANPNTRDGGMAPPPKGFAPGLSRPSDPRSSKKKGDAFGLFDEEGSTSGEGPRQRHIPKLQKQALDTLHLEEHASMEDVRQRYKELVKKFHPDANGGNRGAEDRLRDVINAYRTLRAANFR